MPDLWIAAAQPNPPGRDVARLRGATNAKLNEEWVEIAAQAARNVGGDVLYHETYTAGCVRTGSDVLITLPTVQLQPGQRIRVCTGRGTPQWVGLANFRTLIHDEIFWKALRNTLWYTLFAVPPDIAIAMLLAVLINQKLRFMRLFRLAYFVPVVTATAIVAVVWQWLYTPTGIINGVFKELGFEPRFWLSDPGTVLPALAVMAIWKHVGFNMLIFLAGLQSIPAELEEAARLDGAGRVRIFFTITLPLMRPVVVLATILTTIGSFQVFDSAYVMTGGGSGTSLLANTFFVELFEFGDAGRAAAVVVVLMIAVVSVMIYQMRQFAKQEAR